MRRTLVTIHIMIPVLVIFMLSYVTFVASEMLFAEGWLFSSLMIYFPIVYLLQGVACALLRSNIFVSLGVSIAAFIIVLLIWMNDSAIFYIVVYLVIGLIGYYLTRLVQKMVQHFDVLVDE